MLFNFRTGVISFNSFSLDKPFMVTLNNLQAFEDLILQLKLKRKSLNGNQAMFN